MQKYALVSAIALTIPLLLYGVPYVYAATTSSTYMVFTNTPVPKLSYANADSYCINAGDYATGGGFNAFQLTVISSYAVGPTGTSGANPDHWHVYVYNPNSADGYSVDVQVVCQTPITVAGIGIPEFGQLYVAIALGAIVYFLMARRFTRQLLT